MIYIKTFGTLILKILFFFIFVAILNWLYEIFDNSSFFVFTVILFFAWTISANQDELSFLRKGYFENKDAINECSEKILDMNSEIDNLRQEIYQSQNPDDPRFKFIAKRLLEIENEMSDLKNRLDSNFK